jgi:hypothetical protein
VNTGQAATGAARDAQETIDQAAREIARALEAVNTARPCPPRPAPPEPREDWAAYREALREWLLGWPDGTGFHSVHGPRPGHLWQLRLRESHGRARPRTTGPALVNTYNGYRFRLDAGHKDLGGLVGLGPFTVACLGEREDA